MLNPKSYCPMADEEYDRIFNSDYVKELNKKNRVYFTELSDQI